MSYIPSQADLNLLKQKKQTKYIKIELLNKNMNIVHSIEGELISDTLTIDSSSNCRRVYNAVFFIKDSSFLVSYDTKIWLDKYLKVYTGIVYERTHETIWYNQGIFLMNEYTYNFNETTKTLSLDCVDLMALTDGTLGGIITGALSSTIETVDSITNKENYIRDVLVDTITQLGGFKKFIIEDVKENVPYDLEFSTGISLYEILSSIRDLYYNWEMYFDIDTTFIFQKYSSSYNDPIVLDTNTFTPLVISENTSNSFSNIFNFVEIWGMCLDADYYSENCINENSTYKVTFEGLSLTDSGKIPNNTKIAVKINQNNKASQTMNINSLGSFSIYADSENLIASDTLEKDKCYVFKYYKETFYLQGQYQIHALAIETDTEPSESEKTQNKIEFNCDNIYYSINSESPYSISKIGKKAKVLSGGEYEKIYTDKLALERAEYELWKSTRFQDTVSLEMMHIPWLDVNQKVEYTSIITGETNQYIITRITSNTTDGKMSVEMMKFYPLYKE